MIGRVLQTLVRMNIATGLNPPVGMLAPNWVVSFYIIKDIS